MSPPIISIPFRTLPCTSPPPPSDRTRTQDSTTLLFPPISLHSPSPKDDEDDKKDLSEPPLKYVLDRRRYGGLGALVLLNIVCAMNWVLFTAIASQTAGRFRISYTGVNWLANIVCGMYVFTAPFVPWIVRRVSIRGISILGAILLCLGAWLRYAATANMFVDNSGGAYGLLFAGSVCVGIAQCFFQVIAPAFSETWFGLSSRTTVTSLIAIANPFGGAIGDILAPAIVTNAPDVTQLLFIVALISTGVVPFVFLVATRPKSPPTRSAEERSEKSESGWKSFKVLLGIEEGLDRRERADFWIIAFLFTVLIGFFDAFLTLTNQIFAPVGYDSNTAGFIGAAVIISGLVAALVSAPLFDRYFHFRLALASKILVPIIGISFFALIWAVKPEGLPGLYILAVLMGVSSFIMLPVALELSAEVVFKVASPLTTSSILYLLGNGFSVVTVVGMNALRASADADPPFNMRNALLFQGIFVLVASFAVFGLRGTQSRKETDLQATRR